MAKKKIPDKKSWSMKKVSRLAYSVNQLVTATGLCRGFIYKAIADGKLKAKKAGTRTVILRSAALAYLKSLPDLT